MVVSGFALMALSYFGLAAPWGFHAPRIPYAPLVFIIGVVLVYTSAIAYELKK